MKANKRAARFGTAYRNHTRAGTLCLRITIDLTQFRAAIDRAREQLALVRMPLAEPNFDRIRESLRDVFR